MKRICLFGVTVIAAGLACVSVAVGASTHTSKTTCHISLTTQAPAGSDSATPATEQGTQYGPVRCHGGFGSGVQADTFKLMSTGNVQGHYTQYFDLGSLHGSFTLTPVGSAPTSKSTFSTEQYKGKAKVTGGTGSYAGTKGKGTVKCSTPDGVHFACTEKLKLT